MQIDPSYQKLKEQIAFRNHRIVEDVKGGINVKLLSDIHEITENHVRRICKQAGIRAKNQTYRQKKRRKSRIKWDKVDWIHNNSALGRILGCSSELVRIKRKKLGKPESPLKGHPCVAIKRSNS